MLTHEVAFELQPQCPHCLSIKIWARAKLFKTVRHCSSGSQLVYLSVCIKKYECKSCARYFVTRMPGLLPYQRSTESFKKEIVHKHHHGITQAQLAQDYRLGSATIERWYQGALRTKLNELKGRKAPKVLGIDEHFFTRKKGYATTLANLSKHKVYDVTLGRSEKSLSSYLLGLKGKENTKVILMDLSETYRSICKKHFSNALIVADRFHVVRLINHTFLKVWSQLDEQGRKNRGLLSLMRRHAWNMREDQKQNLNRYLNKNLVLKAVYEFKQELNRMMLCKRLNQKECYQRVPKFLKMIEQLKEAPIAALQTLGKTLESWQVEIARMWRFTKTNSITEGLHNKMEMLSRRAFGFKNFENYRVRVLSHCGGLSI